MNVNIIYLPYRRFHYSEVLIKTFNAVKSRNFHITVCGMNHHRELCKSIVDKFNKLGISANDFIVTTGGSNYLDKLNGTINSPYKYTIKLDEDIFLNPSTWDYFLDNLSVLDNDSAGIFSPILSSGIPTCDLFINKHMDEPSKRHLEGIFSKTNIPNLWGTNYEKLNNLIKRVGYNSNSFYNEVKNIQHHYKGIHPIRVSLDGQLYLNEWIMNNFDKFFTNVSYTIEDIDRPYICNSVFAIKTSTYRSILNDNSLFRDCYDEVAVNNYLNKYNKKTVFISNNFGIHTMYNTLFSAIFPNKKQFIIDKEEEFFLFIKKEVYKNL